MARGLSGVQLVTADASDSEPKYAGQQLRLTG